ncbi:hypothetical protein DSUL_60063 [Desulfovibrionales bacterium]
MRIKFSPGLIQTNFNCLDHKSLLCPETKNLGLSLTNTLNTNRNMVTRVSNLR